MLFKSGNLSASTWHVPEIEASHANLSRVADCFTGEIQHSRETGPPEQPQHEVRRCLAQSRPSAAPRTIFPLCHASHTSTDQVMTSLRKSIDVSPSLLPVWGFGAAPATQDIPRAIASSAVPAETTGRCPRRPGEDAGRRSSRRLPCDVRCPLCVIQCKTYILLIPR